MRVRNHQKVRRNHSLLCRSLFMLFLGASLVTSAVPAAAVSIAFEVTDLADVTAGEDLYPYSYTMSDFPYPAIV